MLEPRQSILDEIKRRGYIPHDWRALSPHGWECDCHHPEKSVNGMIRVTWDHVTIFEQSLFFTVAADIPSYQSPMHTDRSGEPQQTST